jgi:hypothetical protein
MATRIVLAQFFILTALLVLMPSGALSAVPRYDREAIRYQLLNLFNEADLLIRNEKSDELDLARQEREAKVLRIYDRIPFSEQLDQLRHELATGAKAKKLADVKVTVVGRSPKPAPVPKSVFTDEARFKLSDNQLVETIYLKIQVKGSKSDVRAWVKSWAAEQMRLIEPRSGYGNLSMKPLGKVWVVEAKAFRFRDVEFPRLISRNPVELLPAWARKNPDAFAQAEPKLWQLIEQTQALQPKAQPYYEKKRKYLLSQAREEFFLGKATRGEAAAGHR